MTENEAIDILGEFETDKPFLEMIYGDCHEKALKMATRALEEIQQYRSIGTLEQIKEMLAELARWHSDRLNDKIKNPFACMSTLICHNCDHKDEYIEELEAEIEEYKAIGTVSECREAVEKQRGKKPILYMNEISGTFVDYINSHEEYKIQMKDLWRCPCCNEVVGERVANHNHIHNKRKKKYCENCGQAISWQGD